MIDMRLVDIFMFLCIFVMIYTFWNRQSFIVDYLTFRHIAFNNF